MFDQFAIYTCIHVAPLCIPVTLKTSINLFINLINKPIHNTAFVETKGVHPLSNGCLDNAFFESNETCYCQHLNIQRHTPAYRLE